jgi:hypothetical protein
MKMDIANPMPPGRRAPKIWRQLKFGGNLQIPRATAVKHLNAMPDGLPMNSPVAMPMPFAEASSDPPADAAQWPHRGMAAASLDIGRLTRGAKGVFGGRLRSAGFVISSLPSLSSLYRNAT